MARSEQVRIRPESAVVVSPPCFKYLAVVWRRCGLSVRPDTGALAFGLRRTEPIIRGFSRFLLMELGRTLYVADRKAWRAWLKRHHKDKEGVWLIYHRKSSGKPRIPYNDAVEEALCFGWIDSTVKRMDDERFAQRFSPRRKNSALSQMNKERIRKLVSQRRMTKAGLAAVSHAFSHAPDRRESEIAEDILKGIRADSEAWKHFQRLPESYKRIRIAYIESRRRQGEDAFQRSLRNFIRMTAKGRRFGMVRG